MTILVTSRAPLRLAAEHEYVVPSLATPEPDRPLAELEASDAVRLFADRARSVRSGFRLTAESAGDVARLAACLDGLPLAIELAAAWTRLLSPAELVDRLDDRFELLEGGRRDLPGRQQTLRATIDWSFDLLGATEQRILIELGVFAGGWTMAAAEAVCDPESTLDLLDPVSVLLDHSLVVSRDAGDAIRFGMLESIRAYALERLARNGAAEPVRERHAAYFLALAEQARPQLTGPRQQTWLARLEADHDNLRAALTHLRDTDDTDALARMGVALTYFWWIHGHLSEGHGWLTQTLERLEDDHPQRGYVLKAIGVLAYVQGDYAAARDHSERALPLLQAAGDESEVASVVGNLGILALEDRDWERARPLLEEALTYARRSGQAGKVGPALINLGLLLLRQGELDAARAHLEEAVAVNRRIDDRWRLTTGLLNLSEVLLLEGEIQPAHAALTESLEHAGQLGDADSVTFGLEAAGSVAIAWGRAAEAAELWGAAEALREFVGTRRPPGSAAESYQSDVARTRAQLGDDAYAAAWARGRTRSQDDAVALARTLRAG